MTPDEYRGALDELGFTIPAFATWVGVSRSTAFGYGKHGPPKPIVRLLECLLRAHRIGRELTVIPGRS